MAVVYYRAHELSGNTAFVDTLCAAISEQGGNPLPVFCASLRHPDPELIGLLGQADTVITTVLAAGGSNAAGAADGAGTPERWPPWASRFCRGCA